MTHPDFEGTYSPISKGERVCPAACDNGLVPESNKFGFVALVLCTDPWHDEDTP
jgi:hypothetical protein